MLSPGKARQGRRRRLLSYQVSNRCTSALHFAGERSFTPFCDRLFEGDMSGREKLSEPLKRPKRRGPLPVAQNATALLRHHLKVRGFTQVELVTRWTEIAGASLADHCFPYKLSPGSSGGSTLTLVADNRAALELQHQTPKLIDKINTYFGDTTINKIKVVAGEIPKSLSVQPAPRRLTVDEEAELLRRTASVEDPVLRDALTRLGRNAIGESRKTALLKR